MRKPKRVFVRSAYRPTRYSAFRISIIFSLAVLFLLATGSAQIQRRRIAGPTNTKSADKVKDARNSAKSNTRRASVQDPLGETVGVPRTGERGIQRTTAEIMQAQQVAPPSSRPPLKPEHQIEGREDRPQNPDAKPVAGTPDLGVGAASEVRNNVIANAPAPSAPQTVGTNFNAVTGPTETGEVEDLCGASCTHGVGWKFGGPSCCGESGVRPEPPSTTSPDVVDIRFIPSADLTEKAGGYVSTSPFSVISPRV